MIEIQIYNAYSRVNCTPLLQDICSDILSYTMPGAHFANISGWDGRTRLMNKAGEFPTGLMHTLCRALREKKIKFGFKDFRKKPSKAFEFGLKSPFPPRPYQEACTVMSDERNRGVFLMGTGAGKTLTSALIVNRRGVQTLIVAPDTGLRTQLTEEYKKWFPAKWISNSIDSTAPIVIANIQAIAKKKPKVFHRFQMLVIDEFHHSAAKSYKKVNKYCINAYYRYGFTGTFTRSAGDTMEMHGVLSQVIFRITTSELIRAGYLVKPEVTLIHYALEKMRCGYRDAYNALIKDVQLQQIIANIANAEIKAKKQTLIVVRRREHGQELAELIPGAVYLDGKSKDRELWKKKFVNREVRCLVSTNIFGEGQDIPTIDSYVNARFEKTEIWTKQGIGRALRKAEGKCKAFVYDFLITGHTALKQHSNERHKSYSSEPEFVIVEKKSEEYL